MSRHLAEQTALESRYERNHAVMAKAEDRLKKFRIILIYGNIVLSLFSFFSTYVWLSQKKYAWLYYNGSSLAELNTEKPVIFFPIFCITVVIGPLFVVLSILADGFKKGKLLNILGIIAFVLCGLTVINGVFGFEPVKPVNTVAFSVVMALEVLFSFRYVAAVSTIESLKEEPGFPYFNFSVTGLETAEQKKYTEYYNRLLAEADKASAEGAPAPAVMEEAVPGVMPESDLTLPDEDYEMEDIRKKPLF